MPKWEANGEWVVYLGENALAAGNHGKYYVFAGNIEEVRIEPHGKMKTVEGDKGVVHLGNYPKNHASRLVDIVDFSLEGRHTNCVLAIVPPEGKHFDARWLFNRESSGRLLVYEKGDTVSLAHELGHLAAGQLEDRDTSSVLPEEKEAIAYEVGLLKKEGQFEAGTVGEIASGLKTYLRGSKATRHQRAKQIVSKIAKSPLPSCSISVKTVAKTGKIPRTRRRKRAS